MRGQKRSLKMGGFWLKREGWDSELPLQMFNSIFVVDVCLYVFSTWFLCCSILFYKYKIYIVMVEKSGGLGQNPNDNPSFLQCSLTVHLQCLANTLILLILYLILPRIMKQE